MERSSSDPLQIHADQLDRALKAKLAGREQEWARSVRSALIDLERALHEHAACVDAGDGVFGAATGTDQDTLPTVSRRISKLRKEHFDFTRRAQYLRYRVEFALHRLSPATEPGVWRARACLPNATHTEIHPHLLRESGRRLVDQLRGHRAQEIKLLQAALNQDTGVGD